MFWMYLWMSCSLEVYMTYFIIKYSMKLTECSSYVLEAADYWQGIPYTNLYLDEFLVGRSCHAGTK